MQKTRLRKSKPPKVTHATSGSSTAVERTLVFLASTRSGSSVSFLCHNPLWLWKQPLITEFSVPACFSCFVCIAPNGSCNHKSTVATSVCHLLSMTEISPANNRLVGIKETTVFYRERERKENPTTRIKNPLNFHHDAGIYCLYTSLGILIFHQWEIRCNSRAH